jgi:hypothetical protein
MTSIVAYTMYVGGSRRAYVATFSWLGTGALALSRTRVWPFAGGLRETCTIAQGGRMYAAGWQRPGPTHADTAVS